MSKPSVALVTLLNFQEAWHAGKNAETVRNGPSVDLLRTSFPKISLPHCLMHLDHAVKALSLVILITKQK